MDNSKAIEFFRQSIEGKTVVFVGAGAINKSKGYGEWIDSFDVVIKTNGSLFLQAYDDFRRDFGSRIDLLYVNSQFIREMHPLDKKYMKSVGIRGMGFKTGITNKAKYYQDTFYVRSFGGANKEVLKMVGKDGFMTGSLIYQDVVQFKPDYFYATGIDFAYQKPREFKPNDFSEYVSGYLPEKIIKQSNEKRKGKLFSHSRYKTALHFKKLYDNGLIDADPQIIEIANYVIDNKDYYDV